MHHKKYFKSVVLNYRKKIGAFFRKIYSNHLQEENRIERKVAYEYL